MGVGWNQMTVRPERWVTRSLAGVRGVEEKRPTQATGGSVSTGPKAPGYWSGYARGGGIRWTGTAGDIRAAVCRSAWMRWPLAGRHG